jgi:NADH-quinone oxidoreductase subunit L
MEGPTPVSALIHAATMVVAGVYLVARTMPLFDLADPVALHVVTALGLTTVFLSATIGLVANDIKRVVAYSTLNSLGLMMVALGSRDVTAAMFYLFVHGFFKALLFMAAGNVIHATDRQEVTQLGGLAAKMPQTAAAFGVGVLSMAALIPFSGFWAKDAILHGVSEHQHAAVTALVAFSAFLTAVYIARLYILTFTGQPRDRHAYEHAHEAPPVMLLPVLVLAAISVVAGFWAFDGVGEALGFPGSIGKFVFFEEPVELKFPSAIAVASIVSVVAGLAVAGWAWWGEARPAQVLAQRFRPLYQLLWHKYYIDEAYQWVIDRIVLALGRVIAWFDRVVVNDTGVDGTAGLAFFTGFELKFLQTGRLPNYALAIAAGALIAAAVVLAVRI